MALDLETRKRTRNRAEDVNGLDRRQRYDLDIVGDDITLEAHGKSLRERSIALDDKAVLPVHIQTTASSLPFAEENAGLHGLARNELAQVDSTPAR